MCLATLASLARAQSHRDDRIALVVSATDGQPVPFADVEIVGEHGPIFTDANGAFHVGTVARGKLQEDDHLYRGYTSTPAAQGGKPQVKFFDDFPQQVKVDDALMHRGEERYRIYCAACHGEDGYGRGPVRVRSEEIQQPLPVSGRIGR